MRRWIQTMSACETTIAVILEHCTRLHEQRQQQARRAPAHTLQRHMWPHGTSTTLIVLSEQTLHNCRSLENLPTRARTHTHTNTITREHHTTRACCSCALRLANSSASKRVTRQSKRHHSRNVRAWCPTFDARLTHELQRPRHVFLKGNKLDLT